MWAKWQTYMEREYSTQQHHHGQGQRISGCKGGAVRENNKTTE